MLKIKYFDKHLLSLTGCVLGYQIGVIKNPSDTLLDFPQFVFQDGSGQVKVSSEPIKIIQRKCNLISV